MVERPTGKAQVEGDDESDVHPDDRGWVVDCLRRLRDLAPIETELSEIPLPPRLNGLRLYIKREAEQPSGSHKHRLAAALPTQSVMGAGTGGTAAWRDSSVTGKGSHIEGVGRPRVEASFIPTTVDRMIRVRDAASAATLLCDPAERCTDEYYDDDWCHRQGIVFEPPSARLPVEHVVPGAGRPPPGPGRWADHLRLGAALARAPLRVGVSAAATR
ncbi:hypothetical protein [Streptomyces marincola]|uniref:hypothetical protein n=1 Tax=Streptomyces marincola TaxID=2878388 RepID=UPI001CF1B17D|nr:hypothetical protein [Streptomyces marincola]UCM92019.1 hypothetical protein LC193_18380 [Streptomyces marincola]